jgi:cysteine synthase B
MIKQTGGRLTHFVAAMGTSGTFTGVTKRLRRDLPDVQCWSAQPSSGFHGLEGLAHADGDPSGVLRRLLATATLVETEDAHKMVRAGLARKRDCWWDLVGVQRARGDAHRREIAGRGEQGMIVTVLDSAEKYLSEHFWDD